MKALGDSLVALLSSASRSALIAAPFVRTHTLVRLLDAIPNGIDTTIVTRWRPADLLSGASDLEILDAAEDRSIPLLLRSDLHAKLFAVDDRCLVGSANVTDSALGWRTPSNLELLTLVDRSVSDIVELEEALLSGAVRATRELQSSLRRLIDGLGGQSDNRDFGFDEDSVCPGVISPEWVPKTMNPEELYRVYTGDCDNVSRTALPDMLAELEGLGVVSGLEEVDFRAWVAASIVQTPLINGVVQYLESEGPLVEESFALILDDLGIDSENYSAQSGLKVLERWLSYFLPDQYQVIRDSIKLIRVREV